MNSIRILIALSLLLAYSPAPMRPTAAAPAVVNPAVLAPWFLTTVDAVGDVGRFASLSIHPGTGLPYVTYVKATNSAIETAHLAPGTGDCVPNSDWKCNDSGFISQGRFVSMAFAPSGDCRRAYQSANSRENRLNFFQGCFGAGGVSSDSQLDQVAIGATGLYNSLKVDLGGAWHLAFQTVTTTASLRYAAHSNGPDNCNFAHCDVIDQGAAVGAGASLDLNGANRPRIAYRGASGKLSYARFLSSTLGNCGPANTWQCDVIDAGAVVSHSISLYVPKCFLCSVDDIARIAYYDLASDYLKIAAETGSGNCGPGNTWQCDAIASVGSIGAPGVSLSAVRATPFIAFYDANDYPQSPHGVLKIARPVSALGIFSGNCGPGNPFGTWQCDVIDDGGFFVNDVGHYPSLAVNSAGLATIAYYDATDGKLKAAYQRYQTFLPLVTR